MKFNFKQMRIYDLSKCLLILLFSTVVALALESMGVAALNIILVYLISVLLVTIETKGYFLGFFSSIFCVFSFNFFFTEPKYTFQVADSDYVMNFILFLIVSFITSTLVSRLQLHSSNSCYNEKQSRLLYEISSGYLNISGIENILRYGVNSLNQIQNRHAIVYPAKGLTKLDRPYCSDDSSLSRDEFPENNTLALWCLSNVIPCGFGTSYFSTSPWKYLPIKSNSKILGVAAFLCKNKDIDEEETVFINTIISQMALAMEREQIYENQENTRIEMEMEQLQSNILRSISHDLRTPLTGIAGSSSFIAESYDRLDKETILSLLSDINSDANWLNQLTENLLSTTRIKDGKIQLKKGDEVIDDVVYEACKRVEKRLKAHTLSIHVPEQVESISMDGKLIIQVLVNLLDNAIKHTKADCTIQVSAYRENNYMAFEVTDDGGGLTPNVLERIFSGFLKETDDEADSHRGMGLGLSICKSIVEAHAGTIVAYNNQTGGATFKFMLPLSLTSRYQSYVTPHKKPEKEVPYAGNYCPVGHDFTH